MKFNTNHLGYKLFSGQLKEKRVHSEQLNKFLAGFFDSDGSVYLRKNGEYYRIHAEITQSFKTDNEGKLLAALKDFYGLGSLRYRNGTTTWFFNVKDTKKLFNIIGKHLIVKRWHYDNMIDLYDRKHIKDIEGYRKESRYESANFTIKKHISPAYLAGFICGDGYICYSVKTKPNGKIRNQLKISILVGESDRKVLEAFQRDYGGKLNIRKNGNVNWDLALGRESYGRFQNVKPIIDFLLLDYKYESFNKIIQFHNKPQRLNVKDSNE